MTINWWVVVWDVLIILACWSNFIWCASDLKKKLVVLLGCGFLCVGIAQAIVMTGDIALALGYQQGSLWFLTREFRAFPNRVFLFTAMWGVNLVLRFGRWADRRG